MITRLVDQALRDLQPPARGARSDSGPPRVARSDAEVEPEVAAQRRVAEQLRSSGPAVPEHLVSAIEARVNAAYGPRARLHPTRGRGAADRSVRRRRSPARPRWAPALALGALVATAAVIAIAAFGPGRTAGRPGIVTAALLARSSPTGSAPPAKSATLLDASYAGITFPSYARFSTRPTGIRADRIDGRRAMTVFYRLPGGQPLSYTVFAGRPLPLPHAAIPVSFHGIGLRTMSAGDGLAVVTLVRLGHTCVLAAPTDRDTVLELAAAPIRAPAAA